MSIARALLRAARPALRLAVARPLVRNLAAEASAAGAQVQVSAAGWPVAFHCAAQRAEGATTGFHVDLSIATIE